MHLVLVFLLFSCIFSENLVPPLYERDALRQSRHQEVLIVSCPKPHLSSNALLVKCAIINLCEGAMAFRVNILDFLVVCHISVDDMFFTAWWSTPTRVKTVQVCWLI